ncbi:MarR family transcriptional regulator [Gordonia sp. OPL2]|uniref:MarR family transcriptional regulator n=1 Tax=Gordonia sp. OPL2 TaxID=2486274 RepID=UPI00165520D6|nr:MarR family transcriptional regulator [Gordonia sp. OPL2]ROZ87310.1 MarR family transcriptional regulator [Gordonia sp. OPL2]
MDHPQLTPSESAVLFVLMAQAREVRNPDLAALAPELKKSSRDKLNRLGLIESRKGARNAFSHSLTDRGWAWCAQELSAAPPPKSLPPIRALYAVMAGVGRYLEASDLRLHEVFGVVGGGSAADAEPSAEPPADAVPLERRIRATYNAVTSGPGRWVGVLALRQALAGIDRSELDTALVALQREPGVSLIPQEDQMLLTDDGRKASVRVGTQDCHLFAIEEV